MIYDYQGYIIHQTGIHRFYVIGYSFRGWFLSVIEAVKIIDSFIADQCRY